MASGDIATFSEGAIEKVRTELFSHYVNVNLSDETQNTGEKETKQIDKDLHEIVRHETSIYALPDHIRETIWSYLDPASLENARLIFTEFQQEVAKPKSLIDVMWMTYLPLWNYLDVRTENALRLACKEMKTIIDCEVSRRKGCQLCAARWCPLAREAMLASLDYDYIGESAVDLKRIFAYLEEPDLVSVEKACTTFKRVVDELRKYGYAEYKDNFHRLHLMDLPSEIHKKILNLCHCTDRPTLRLVSKLMQFQVDTLAGVTIYLNELKWSWSSTYTRQLPPAYSLIATNVENMQAVKLIFSDYNRKLLTRLVLDGQFLAKAMILVLNKCKNLRYIGLTYALDMSSLEDELRKSFPQKCPAPLELYSLRALDLKIRESELPRGNVFRVHSWTWANAFEFLRPTLFVMPKLTSFRICEERIFSHNLIYEVADKVVKFLAVYRHTLKYLSVILLGSCFRLCGCPTYAYDVSESILKELKLVEYSHDCDWRISRPFTVILNAQTCLQKLACIKLSDWEYYAGIIGQNKQTLRSVTIEKNMTPVIDLGAFETCENLEYLWISQFGSPNLREIHHNTDYYPGHSIRFDQRLTNWDKLPINLKSLHILDQTTDASKIQSIPQRLKRLETLDLQFIGCWNGRDFGLTERTILEIVQLRKLNNLFLEEIRKTEKLNSRALGIIAEINLIPEECSQFISRVGCILSGVLVAEKLPCPDFLPDWQARVSSYFEARDAQHEMEYNVASGMLFEALRAAFENDDEPEENYSDNYSTENDESSLDDPAIIDT